MHKRQPLWWYPRDEWCPLYTHRYGLYLQGRDLRTDKALSIALHEKVSHKGCVELGDQRLFRTILQQ